jgi:endonuclease VIII
MPEGHTIHRIARDHGRLLAGRRLAVSSPQGRFEAAALLDGRRLLGIEPCGKHLFYDWGDGQLVHVHLGLFGKYRVHRHGDAGPPEAVGAVRMRLSSAEVTVDLAGPTACHLVSPGDRDRILDRLGPDPLRPDADPKAFVERVVRSRAPVGGLLLDQSVVSGIGNVYRAEALFVHGIHPTRPGRTLDRAEAGALWDTLATMLRQGVADGRILTVTRAELGKPRSRATRSEATYAYKQVRCRRCGTAIERFVLAARTCYACPTCQPS